MIGVTRARLEPVAEALVAHDEVFGPFSVTPLSSRPVSGTAGRYFGRVPEAQSQQTVSQERARLFDPSSPKGATVSEKCHSHALSNFTRFSLRVKA